MKVTVVIQARTGSSRLPGKVLMPVAGASLLQRMVERVCAARTPSEVVIATTELPIDDAIVGAIGVSGGSGSQDNVVSLAGQAALK